MDMVEYISTASVVCFPRYEQVYIKIYSNFVFFAQDCPLSPESESCMEKLNSISL